ncbi:MAG: hypothetical protein Hals2KO_01460 [Halioglobus sp.]
MNSDAPLSVSIVESDGTYTRGNSVERDASVSSSTLGLWDLTFNVLGRHRFELSRQFLVTDGVMLYIDHYGSDTHIMGSTLPDMFTVGIPLNSVPNSQAFGECLTDHQPLASFQSCIDIKLGEGQCLLVAMVHRRFFQQHSGEEVLQDIERVCRSRWITPAPHALSGAKDRLLGMLDGAMYRGYGKSELFGVEIAEVIVGLVQSCDGGEPAGCPSTRRQGYERALEILDAGTADVPSITALCTEAGVSQRTLEYAFREYTGMTPIQFINHARHTQLRKILLTDFSCTSVEEAASRVGIGELGRMAAEYRRRFGELPSQSLAKRTQRPAFTLAKPSPVIRPG